MLVASVLALMPALAVGPLVESWEAPHDCPTRTEMQARLTAQATAPELRMRGHIVELGPGLRLELTLGWDGAHEQRILMSRSCEVLSESALLLVGIGMGPPNVPPTPPQSSPPAAVELETRVSHESASDTEDGTVPAPVSPAPQLESQTPLEPELPEPSTPPSPPPSPGASPSTPSTLDADRGRPDRTPGLYVRISGGIGTGAVAPIGVPLGIVVGLSWARLRLALRGTYWTPRRPRAPLQPEERGGRVQLGTVGPQACIRASAWSLEFPQCVQLGIGANRIDGFGPDTRRAGGLWIDVGGSTGVLWSMFRRDRLALALALELSVTFPLSATGYTLDGTAFFVPGPVVVNASAGLEMHFGPRSPRH